MLTAHGDSSSKSLEQDLERVTQNGNVPDRNGRIVEAVRREPLASIIAMRVQTVPTVSRAPSPVIRQRETKYRLHSARFAPRDGRYRLIRLFICSARRSNTS